MILHLSLERINSGETPYQVEPTEQNGFYQFFTDGVCIILSVLWKMMSCYPKIHTN